MYKLEDLDWNQLNDAYGPAAEVPNLLRQISQHIHPQKATTDEPWFSLWSRLCHQGDVYTASYAAVPYIVEIAGGNQDAASIEMSFYLLPACIEVARAKGRGPQLPEELEDVYKAAIRKLGDYARKYQNATDSGLKKSAQVACFVADGKINEADQLLEGD